MIVCVYIRIYVYVSVCMHVCVSVVMHLCVCARMYASACTLSYHFPFTPYIISPISKHTILYRRKCQYHKERKEKSGLMNNKPVDVPPPVALK